jgi:hypothetical protein
MSWKPMDTGPREQAKPVNGPTSPGKTPTEEGLSTRARRRAAAKIAKRRKRSGTGGGA